MEENGKRLTLEQKEQLLAWIAEGLDSEAINQRAAQQQPPWHVARATVTHYRKTRALPLAEARQVVEQQAIAAGYGTAAQRIAVLTQLAGQMKRDLIEDGKLWTKNRKPMGRGGATYDYEEFNAAEVQQLRGVLDDIAKELGERAIKHEIEAEVDLIWDLPVPGFNPPSESAPAKS